MRLAPKGDASSASVSAFDIQIALVDEIAHSPSPASISP
jgi:hypothetical protein